mmetsp:Transcript_29952/g.79861  ORF Transcript_29952/g.79861 Transcript_29952/m.79861 type:complete len:110 (-) Transcript_29952:611-940(-)
MTPPMSALSPDHRTVMTGFVCDVSDRTQEQLGTFHNLTSPSLEALAKRGKSPATCSGCHHKQVTACECPLKAPTALPLLESHTMMILSMPAEASRLPSGLQATDNTQFL